MRREPSALTLLCLPCAGASATMYLRWRRQLPAWVKLVPVELPGRGMRLADACVEDFGTLVEQLGAEHASAMQEPFALFGHSMGALLAYGLAQRQCRLGQPLPLALGASGCPAPSRREARRYPAKGDHAALIADLRQQGGTPDEVFQSTELMRLVLGVLGADYRVCESFQYEDWRTQGPLPLPVHVLAGRQDDITPERMAAWSAETERLCTLDWFEGGHFFIWQQESAVLAALTQRLVTVAAAVEARPALA